jgi:hypothetical protein
MKSSRNVIALVLLGTVVLASGCQDETPVQFYEAPLVQDVTHVQGRFVAVGGEPIGGNRNDPYTPAVHHSLDGKTWTRLLFSGSGALNAVAYGNDTFVAVGGQLIWDTPDEASIVMISADGQTWEQIELDAAQMFDSIAFGDGRFMAVGRPEEGRASVYSSVDGRVWLEEVIALNGWGQVEVLFAEDRFVMHGGSSQVATWRAGEGWSMTTLDVTEVRHLRVVGDEIIGLGAIEVYYTSPPARYQYDLLRYTPSAGWTQEPLEAEHATDVFDLERVGDQVVAATLAGIAIADDVAAPLPWDVVYDDITPRALVQVDGLLVAAGSGFAWSDDGVFTWHPGVIEPAPGSAPAP